jgi:hypothetical protein
MKGNHSLRARTYRRRWRSPSSCLHGGAVSEDRGAEQDKGGPVQEASPLQPGRGGIKRQEGVMLGG